MKGFLNPYFSYFIFPGSLKDILINFTTKCFSLLKLLLGVSLSLSALLPAALLNFTELTTEGLKLKISSRAV